MTPSLEIAAPVLRPAAAGPWLLLALWLMSAAVGFWVFELRDLRPFEVEANFDIRARQSSAEAWYREHLIVHGAAPVATVVHFFKPNCSCNRFTEPHLARIMARYQQQHVRFVAITPTSAAGLDWLNAAPAALVFDGAGHLVYFGPYSSTAWCGTGGGQVEGILDRLLSGARPQLAPSYGRGCFC